ncbi:MAG: ATPase, partial [Actinocatenispora sp.]
MVRLLRLGLLVLVSALILVASPHLTTVGWCALLTVAALPGLLIPDHPVLGRLGRIAEVVVIGLSTAALATPYGSTLPFLLVSVRSAAVFASSAEAVATVVLAAATVLCAGAVGGRLGSAEYLIPAVLWLLLGLASVVAGRRLYPPPRDHSADPQPYAAATRLLTQLRTVARQLPGGTLDLGGIAAGLLDEVGASAPADRAA